MKVTTQFLLDQLKKNVKVLNIPLDRLPVHLVYEKNLLTVHGCGQLFAEVKTELTKVFSALTEKKSTIIPWLNAIVTLIISCYEDLDQI